MDISGQILTHTIVLPILWCSENRFAGGYKIGEKFR